jgi:hypothetical protein
MVAIVLNTVATAQRAVEPPGDQRAAAGAAHRAGIDQIAAPVDVHIAGDPGFGTGSERSQQQGYADTLHIAENTVKIHLRNILEKLHVQNRSQAAVHAVRKGLVEDIEATDPEE